MEETPRRLLALVEGLPSDAVTWREERVGWTDQDEMLARVSEVMDAWGRTLLGFLIASRTGKRPPHLGEPLFYDHPERRIERPGASKVVSIAEFVSQNAKQRR